MSGSGNMIPQSRMTMRPSTSMQAQLRPISPSPPRKTTRTGLAFGLLARSAKRGARDGDRWWPDAGQDLLGLGIELGGGCTHRQAALAHRQTQCAQHGLGGQRVRELLGGLEIERVGQLGVA